MNIHDKAQTTINTLFALAKENDAYIEVAKENKDKQFESECTAMASACRQAIEAIKLLEKFNNESHDGFKNYYTIEAENFIESL